jgi:hypothetical protein
MGEHFSEVASVVTRFVLISKNFQEVIGACSLLLCLLTFILLSCDIEFTKSRNLHL